MRIDGDHRRIGEGGNSCRIHRADAREKGKNTNRFPALALLREDWIRAGMARQVYSVAPAPAFERGGPAGTDWNAHSSDAIIIDNGPSLAAPSQQHCPDTAR